jgi:hypothetical protein
MVQYPSAGRHYNPYTVVLYGMEKWEAFLATGDRRHLESFLRQADWLVANQEQGKWYYRFDTEVAGDVLHNPWVSSLCQGKAASLLLRAWQFTGNTRYREAADAGLALFEVPIDQGGICSKAAEGTWFEEYPNPTAHSHVMNGHIWAMFGLWDSWRATADSRARELFSQGASVLKANLARYDTGYWARYSLTPDAPCINSAYMHFEIDQLRVLQAITGDRSFGQCADRWETYHRSFSSFCRIILSGAGRRLQRVLAR